MCKGEASAASMHGGGDGGGTAYATARLVSDRQTFAVCCCRDKMRRVCSPDIGEIDLTNAVS